MRQALHLAIYLAVAVALSWPAWGGPDALIGGGDQPDWTGTAWASWWTGHALSQGLSPFDGSWNFFPLGQRPVAQYNLLDALLFSPLLAIFGPRLGYNLAALGVMVSAAMGMDRLTRVAGAGTAGGLLAGLGLESSTFLIMEITHGRLSQGLLVFFLLALSGIVQIGRGQGSWRIAGLTGLMVGATALTYWYFGLFLILAAAPLWLAELRAWDRGRWAWLGLAAAVALALTLPPLVLLSRGYGDLPGVQRAFEAWLSYGWFSREEFGLSMAISQSHWPGWPVLHTLSDPDEKLVSAAVLVLGLGGLLWRPWGRLRWLVVALIGYLLTLGPYPKLADGLPRPFELPYLWLYEHLPFFDRFWWPQRLELLVWVGLLVLAGLHLDRLLAWSAARWPRVVRWAAWLLPFLALADLRWRHPYVPIIADPPPAIDLSLYSSVDGPIVTTPVLSEGERSRHLLWMQIFHQQPILAGLGDHIPSHRPPGYAAYIQDNGLLSALAKLSVGELRSATIDPIDVQALIDDGFVWAVVDPAIYSPQLQGAWAAAFSELLTAVLGAPEVQSGDGAAWRLTPIPTRIRLPHMQAVEHVGPRVPQIEGGG